jgi:deazaflavin-dependent oxidoreductase (nitroreductase family)
MSTPERPARVDMRVRNLTVMAEFRANAGQSSDDSPPLVIITTIGAKTGNPHATPICVREDGDRLIVAGSAGGMAKHPQWYRNLVANPVLTVEYGGETYQAQATTVPNSLDRNRLFDMMSTVIVGLYGYQDKCREHRQIPIVSLDRIT